MQPYMDGMLTDDEVAEAKEHLEACPPCDKRYRFEERLRHFVRVATRRADVRRASARSCPTSAAPAA